MSSLKNLQGGEFKMATISPTQEEAAKVLGNVGDVLHAAKCGTCACKCACRYNNNTDEKPW